MSERIPVWLDVDTGIDDAQAILAASRLPLDIRGISAVNGNVAWPTPMRIPAGSALSRA